MEVHVLAKLLWESLTQPQRGGLVIVVRDNSLRPRSEQSLMPANKY